MWPASYMGVFFVVRAVKQNSERQFETSIHLLGLHLFQDRSRNQICQYVGLDCGHLDISFQFIQMFVTDLWKYIYYFMFSNWIKSFIKTVPTVFLCRGFLHKNISMCPDKSICVTFELFQVAERCLKLLVWIVGSAQAICDCKALNGSRLSTLIWNTHLFWDIVVVHIYHWLIIAVVATQLIDLLVTTCLLNLCKCCAIVKKIILVWRH